MSTRNKGREHLYEPDDPISRFRELYDQLSTHPGEPGGASQSHAEGFDLEFKPFERLDKTL
jgi:hypothetical protein